MNQCIDCGAQIIGLHICPKHQTFTLKAPGVVMPPRSAEALAAEVDSLTANLAAEKRLYAQNDAYLRDQLKEKELQIDEMKRQLSWKSCPCEFEEFEPCSTHCTCRNRIQSGGCSRCAKYGSHEQQLASARHLIETNRLISAIQAHLDRTLNDKMPTCCNGVLSEVIDSVNEIVGKSLKRKCEGVPIPANTRCGLCGQIHS